MNLFALFNIPKTNDPFNPIIFIVVLGVCLGLIVLLVTKRSAKTNDNNESIPQEPSETIEEDNTAE
jgi:hypothetical protein